eukprot:9991491-Alexandrium_andersonii.AAC.1
MIAHLARPLRLIAVEAVEEGAAAETPLPPAPLPDPGSLDAALGPSVAQLPDAASPPDAALASGRALPPQPLPDPGHLDAVGKWG